jgi:bifunctional non-homologous end joining protein LigD
VPTRTKLTARDPAFAPMLATLGAPPTGDGHATEWKFDGQRATVVIDDEVTVFSRNGADVSRTFPELAGIAAAIGARRVVLDGEIVAPDAHGRPSFTRLQRRWPQQRRPRPELVREVPCRLIAFDILQIDGRPIIDLPYGQRREQLDHLLTVEKSPVLTVPPAMIDIAPADALDAAATHAMEGIVVKRLDSPCRPGERSPFWIKIPVRATTELIIAGYWCAGGPGGHTAVGSLLMAGHNDAGDLVAIGQVGTGFSAATRRHLYAQLQSTRRSTSPVTNLVEAPGVQWVEPCHVAEIAYREYTPGRWLRHTSFKGLRESADPAQIQLPEHA